MAACVFRLSREELDAWIERVKEQDRIMKRQGFAPEAMDNESRALFGEPRKGEP